MAILHSTTISDDLEVEELPSTSMVLPIEEPPPKVSCSICGSPGAALHYGAFTCSCKVFFLRSASMKKIYMCEKGSKCPYPVVKCRACRFRKCLEMGMDPEAVGRRKQLIAQSKERVEDQLPDLAIVPYFDEKSAARNRFVKVDFDNLFKIQQIVFSLLQVEKRCDNDDGHFQSFLGFGPNLDLDLSLHDALQFPGRICPRTPICFNNDVSHYTQNASVFKVLYSRTTLHFVDWVCTKDEIWQLGDKDRLRLVARQASSVVMTTLTYNSFAFSAEGLMFCHGFQFRENDGPTPESVPAASDPRFSLVSYNNILVTFAHRHILSVYRELHVTREEYVILKNIVFFTAVCNLSEEAAEVVRAARRKYELILLRVGVLALWRQAFQCIEERFPDQTRMHQKIAMLDEAFLTKMVVLDIDAMCTKLTKDFHVF